MRYAFWMRLGFRMGAEEGRENHLEEVDWLRRLGSLTAVGMKADALQAYATTRAALT